MELEDSCFDQQLEHTARTQAAGLFFRRELAITSPRRLSHQAQQSPSEQELLPQPLYHNNGHGDLIRQEARADLFDAYERRSVIMGEAHQELVNIANPPIREEPDWSKASRSSTHPLPPLSSTQNQFTQSEFTGHFSDWLVDGASASPTLSSTQISLKCSRDSPSFHFGFTDSDTQNKDIVRFSHESPKHSQPSAKSTQNGLLLSKETQGLPHHGPYPGELPAAECLVGPFGVRDFIPDDYAPMKFMPHRRPSLPTRDNIKSSLAGGHVFPIAPQEVPGLISTPILFDYKERRLERGTGLPSSLQRSGDAISLSGSSYSSRELIFSTPQIIREQAPFAQDRGGEYDWFLQAGQIYMAYLWHEDPANAGLPSPYTEEEYAWARSRVPPDVKQWLRASKRKHSSGFGPTTTAGESQQHRTTTSFNQQQQGKLASEQQMSGKWAALHAALKAGNNGDEMEDVEQNTKEYTADTRKNSVALPALLDCMAIEKNPPRYNFILARSCKNGIAGEVVENSTSDQQTRYSGPKQLTANTPENATTNVTSSGEKGLYLPNFPGAFMSPEMPQSMSNGKTSKEVPVTPPNSGTTVVSSRSDSSFVTAAEDEVSLIPSGSNPQCVAVPRIQVSNFDIIAEGTKTALNALPATLITNRYTSHLSKRNQMTNIVPLPLHFGNTSGRSGETMQRYKDSLLGNPVQTAENEEVLLEGGDMLMADVADGDAVVKKGLSTLKETSNLASRISQGHELHSPKHEQSIHMTRRSSAAIKEHAPSPGTHGPSINYSSAGSPRYFCRNCEKAYKKRVYLLKHEGKCCRELNQSPQMTSPMDSKSPTVEDPFCMPSLDSKLPSGNSYCTACNKEFTAVGRLRLHIQKACPALKQAGIYNGVKERLRNAQMNRETRARGDQTHTFLLIQPQASPVSSRSQSGKAGSELIASNSPSLRKPKESKGSLNFNKSPLNGLHANSLDSFSVESATSTSRAENTFGRMTTQDHQPTTLVDDVEGKNISQTHQDLLEKSVVSDAMTLQTPLRPNQAQATDQNFTPVLSSPTRKRIQQLDTMETPDCPYSEDGKSSLSIPDSSGEYEDGKGQTGNHSIQGDDKGRILRYPERTRLFSGKITGGLPDVGGSVDPFENIVKAPKSTKRQASTRSDNTGPFAPTSAKTEKPGANLVSSLTVSLADKTLCSVVYGKLKKDLLGNDEYKMKGLKMPPLYEAPASRFEFEITAPKGFDLIAAVGKILPKLSFTHREDKGWMAVLENVAQPSANRPEKNATPSTSDRAPGAKKPSGSVSASGSRLLRSSSVQTSKEPGELIPINKKRTSSRLSELSSKGKEDTVVPNAKRRKQGK